MKKLLVVGMAWLLGAGLASLSANARPLKTFQEPPMPSGVEANRPYEIVWAGRTQDDHPSLIPFVSADGWKVQAMDAVAKLETSREKLLFGEATCKFTFRATGPKATVTLTPSAPVKTTGAFDAVTWWIYGMGRPWRKPHIPLFVTANFTDAEGKPFAVKFPEVNHSEWFMLHRPLAAELRTRTRDGASLVSFTLTGMTNDVEKSVYLNSFCAFKEEMKPLSYRPRAKRPHRVFPAADVGTNTGAGELPFPNAALGVIPRTTATDDLAFRLPSRATAWDDMAFRWKGGPWIAFAKRGGLFFDDGAKELSALAEAETTVVTNSAVPLDVTLGAVQRTKDGRRFRSEVRFHVVGRSLVADVQSEGPVGEVRFGGWGAPDAKLVPVPYYTYVPWGNGLRPQVVSTKLDGRPFFHAAILDWTQSTCSEPIGGSVRDGLALSNYGAIYRKKTDGTRNRSFERLVYAFSDRFEDVLPEIPNPKSPWMHVTGKGVWVSHKASVRSDDIAHWRARRARGIRNLIVTDHETGWRDGKESFTFRTEPAPGKGGNRGQYEYARIMIDEFGYVYGPYNNFTDFAPVNAHWTSDRVIRLPDGRLQDAWDRCYAPKPAYAVEACEDLTPRIQEKFGFNCAYCDVHTSPSPWWRVDYDARVPGAGTFAATFYSWGEIMLIQKKVWNGPVYSEGGMHHIYCGLTDGNYGQDMNYRLPVNPWIVDYDLLKMHPLCCNFGIGAPYMFYENVKPPADRDVAIDRFLAATVAFGHPGFFVSDQDAKLAEKYENRSYFMIQALAAHYTQATAEEIRYLDASGAAYTTSEALANGVYRRSQVRVRYSDGTVVEANGSMTEPMRLADGTTLPPNGYRGRSGDGTVEVFSGLVDGHRVDRAVSPEYVFLDGRGVKTSFPEGEATEQVVRLSGSD